METLFARQAIYDSKLKTVGYQLSFTKSPSADSSVNDAGKEESELRLADLVSGEIISIHYDDYLTHRALIGDFPKHYIYIHFDDSEDLREVAEDLRKEGYHIAFNADSSKPVPHELLVIIDVVKLDISTLQESNLQDIIELLKKENKNILATQIKTRDEFANLLKLGLERFQGSFLCEPECNNQEEITTNGLMVMRLLNLLQDINVSIKDIEAALGQDPRLAYKLLLAVNSPAYGLTRKIESLREAIVFIGLQQIKRWASLAALSSVDEKPLDLVNIAVVRAKMCELLAEQYNYQDPSRFFTIGLFSTLDALLDKPMNDLLEKLVLTDSLKQALLNYEGLLGETLKKVIAYENASWDYINYDANDYKILVKAYIESISWADEFCNAITQ